MASLYNMTAEWENVFNMLLDPEIPEDAVFDTIEMIEADMDTKADSYAKIIKLMEGDEEIIDGEIRRLKDRKTAITNRKNALKSNLENMMRTTGRTKFKTALFSFGIQKNGGLAPLIMLAPTNEIPAEWLKPGEPDTAKIREALERGKGCPFATLGERGESLRIR